MKISPLTLADARVLRAEAPDDVLAERSRHLRRRSSISAALAACLNSSTASSGRLSTRSRIRCARQGCINDFGKIGTLEQLHPRPIVIIAPDESPVEYTRFAFAWYFVRDAREKPKEAPDRRKRSSARGGRQAARG